MSIEANTTTASAAITSTPRITPERTPEGVQSRGDQGDSSAAFSQRTNVSIETAIDHMADILSKVSGRQQANVQQMPAELKEVIQNMIRQSFSVETTLGQGLGSTAASQRFSTDQLTTLARILNQLGTMAETEGSIPRVSDDLAAILTGLKNVLAKESGGTFEPIMLTKAAFQLLDTGNAELLPKELQTFLSQLNAQGSAAGASGGAESTALSFLNQLVQLLMPRGTAENLQQQMQGENAQNIPTNPAQEARSSATNTNVLLSENGLPEEQMLHTQTGVSSERGQNSPAQAGNQARTQSGKELANSMQRQGDPATIVENKAGTEAGTRIAANLKAQAQSAKGDGAASPTRAQAGRDADLANAVKSPLANAAQMKSAEAQNSVSGFFAQTMENTPQTMNVLRNLAQTLLQNENLSQREVLLLQNFVNGRTQTMSEGDVKQLQQLIQLTQQNIPGTVRQAAFEQQLPDLPRLWAFMQMADIVKTRKMTAEQYKRAGRDVAALALTMRSAFEGENAAPQPGQRSMNFVMPLFMGASEYPAYIHVYDESHQDEETNRIKKETWLRICVLTDNIGTVELINRIYEENHVDMRLYFSDADAAWEFRNALDSIRETADGTSLVIEGIQIGAIGERRFFTN